MSTVTIGKQLLRELHLTKKDFKVEWFSGHGAGGQHRNRHKNCCRITHVDTGLTAQGTESRSAMLNKRMAFRRLATRILSFYHDENPKNRVCNELIRTYHGVRNEVVDKKSGLKMPYKEVVQDGNLSPMIEARRKYAE